jgi:uncharacterized glyoxalase superfamily protein PhnB
MEEIVCLRTFVPARDFLLSERFYQRLGFSSLRIDDKVRSMKTGSFSFLLQDFYQKDWAENTMMQLLVRNTDDWWRRIDSETLVADFGIRPPTPPALQPWNMKVGFIWDPSGVLWHIAETLF